MNLPRYQRPITATLCALLVLLASMSVNAPAQAQSDEELLALKVRAAFLFNFIKFVNWPPSKFVKPSDPLQVCVLQPDPFGDILQNTLADKSVDGHALTLRRSARAADLRSCHLVYLGETDPVKLNNELAQLAGNSILLVYENSETLAGGGVRFTVNDRKLRFEVNLAETDRESLQLSSKLLSLADVVRQ